MLFFIARPAVANTAPIVSILFTPAVNAIVPATAGLSKVPTVIAPAAVWLTPPPVAEIDKMSPVTTCPEFRVIPPALLDNETVFVPPMAKRLEPTATVSLAIVTLLAEIVPKVVTFPVLAVNWKSPAVTAMDPTDAIVLEVPPNSFTEPVPPMPEPLINDPVATMVPPPAWPTPPSVADRSTAGAFSTDEDFSVIPPAFAASVSPVVAVSLPVVSATIVSAPILMLAAVKAPDTTREPVSTSVNFAPVAVTAAIVPIAFAVPNRSIVPPSPPGLCNVAP